MDLTSLFPTQSVRIIHLGEQTAYGQVDGETQEVEAVLNLTAGKTVNRHGVEHASLGTLAVPPETRVSTDCLVEVVLPGENQPTRLTVLNVSHVDAQGKAFFPNQVIVTLGERYAS